MPLGVDAIDMAHRAPQVGMGCLEQSMIVIFHQTIRLDVHAKAGMGLGKAFQKHLIVRFTVKYGLPSRAPVHGMVIGIFVFDS